MPQTRNLAKREHQVLLCVFDGLADKQIAGNLQRSESSVKATYRHYVPENRCSYAQPIGWDRARTYRDMI